MKKYIILCMSFVLLTYFAYAQQDEQVAQEESEGSYAPSAGDISGSILFGRGNFLSTPSVPNSANSSWTVYGYAPYYLPADANSNSVSNIVGGEVRYFLTDIIAIKLSGGAIIRSTPPQDNVPGFIDSSVPNAAWIPNYNAVQLDNRIQSNLNIGGEYHFSSKYNRLFPYAGVTLPFYYSRTSMYDPSVYSNDQTYSSGVNVSSAFLMDANGNYVYDGNGDIIQIVYAYGGSSSPINDGVTIVDVGVRNAEVFGFGAQLVGGVDYYLMEGFYFGLEIKPVSYVYTYMVQYPAPGLETLESDNHAFTFFSQVFLKLGFRF